MTGTIFPLAMLVAALMCISTFLLVSATQEATFRSYTRQKQPEAYQERIIEWILEDPDSFFHPAIRFQRLGPEGKSGGYAMHATEDIPKGTPLIVVPRKYVIESHRKRRPESDSKQNDFRNCITVNKVLEEYLKHTDPETTYESFYAPFLSYLFENTVGGTARGLLPGTWSEHSKWLTSMILQPDLEGNFILRPFQLEYNSIYDICEANGNNADEEDIDFSEGLLRGQEDGTEEEILRNEQLAEDAYLFLLSRGWHDKLVPLIDMLNHRNGPHRNVEVTPLDDVRMNDVAAYAWRDIQKGEQLQYSYTECMDLTCSYGEWKYLTTSQYIFLGYGFVEDYPRRWVFDIEDEEGDYTYLYSEVTTDPKDDTKVVFQWIYRTPSTKENIAWMERHLARLKRIEPIMKEGLAELEYYFGRNSFYNFEHERDTVLGYYEAYLEVFELAVKHKDDPVGVTEESFEQEMIELKKMVGVHSKTIDEIRKHKLLARKTSDEL